MHAQRWNPPPTPAAPHPLTQADSAASQLDSPSPKRQRTTTPAPPTSAPAAAEAAAEAGWSDEDADWDGEADEAAMLDDMAEEQRAEESAHLEALQQEAAEAGVHAEPPEQPRTKRRRTAPKLTATDAGKLAAETWERTLARRMAEGNTAGGIAASFEGGIIPREHRWSAASPSHRLSVANSVLFCRICGRWGAWKLQGLRGNCADLMKDGRPSTTTARACRTRLVAGMAPLPRKPWPGGADNGATFAAARVSLNPEV